MRRSSIIIATLVLLGCQPITDPELPGETACQRACSRLSELGCEESLPDDEGHSCVEICEWTVAADIIELDLNGVAESETCPE